MRISLFGDSQDPITRLTFALRHISKAEARHLVENGIAERINKRAIWLKPIKSGNLRSGQGKTYESAAIDPHPRFFDGGLTRNEKNPRNIPKFKAARVGHG